MSYTVHQAKTTLSRQIREARKGKEVIITRGKEPVARLVPVPGGAKKRIPICSRRQIWAAPNAFDPLTEEELRELGFE